MRRHFRVNGDKRTIRVDRLRKTARCGRRLLQTAPAALLLHDRQIHEDYRRSITAIKIYQGLPASALVVTSPATVAPADALNCCGTDPAGCPPWRKRSRVRPRAAAANSADRRQAIAPSTGAPCPRR